MHCRGNDLLTQRGCRIGKGCQASTTGFGIPSAGNGFLKDMRECNKVLEYAEASSSEGGSLYILRNQLG